ncbi:MAG: ATP-dependent zinc metalloprotease FtsH [Candidatus Bipolaricaulota bacterium]|nr:MAG: ATP-dependent zinc metalloprotease FtsH [Candidatus Bipolaricaulota bacterium]
MERDPQREQRNRNLRNIAFVAVLVIIGLIVIQSWLSGNRSRNEIDYTSFIEKVENGEIREITIRDGRGEATTVDNDAVVVQFPPGDSSEYVAWLRDSVDRNGRPITVQFEPSSDGNWFVTILVSLLPIILVLAVLFYIIRRTQGGGALAFGQSKAKLVHPESTRVTFDDVAGMDEVKEEVQEVVDFLKDQKRFARLGAEIPKGVLLVGAPGTGKTLLAKAIAGEAKVPFFSISGSDFVEMFVGVGAARVRDMFEKAKRSAPCIIFVDEIDAVGRKRGAGLGGGHDEREQTLNQLLAEMDGFQSNQGVIILAATNRPDVLDSALLRPGRFDRRVVIPAPAMKEREAILKVHMRGKKIADDIDLGVLARRTGGWVGAHLRNLCNEAALLAARHDKPEITMEDFEEAADRVELGLKRKSLVLTAAERDRLAYHESGHALLGHLLNKEWPVHTLSIIPRSHGALGYTASLPQEERFTTTESELRNWLVSILGGLAAEEIVYEEHSSGAEGDLRQATHVAKEMVVQYGMSETLGPISLARERVDVFLGEEIVKSDEHSEELSSLVDREIRSLLIRSYERAKELLTKHRGVLDRLAHEVLEREVIAGDELRTLFSEIIPEPAV